MNVDMFKKKSKDPDSNALEVVWAAIDMLNMEIRALKHGVVPKKKVKKEGWVNVYGRRELNLWSSKEEADKASNPSRKACIRIEWEEEE